MKENAQPGSASSQCCLLLQNKTKTIHTRALLPVLRLRGVRSWTPQVMEVCDEMLDGPKSSLLVRPLRHRSSAVATAPLLRGRQRKEAWRLLKGKRVELN